MNLKLIAYLANEQIGETVYHFDKKRKYVLNIENRREGNEIDLFEDQNGYVLIANKQKDAFTTTLSAANALVEYYDKD